jgi:glycosyltransferase involved in cell wall biosynthesis
MKLLFVNPYPHHAYFSVLALSRFSAVEILCPPLTIDLFFQRWKTVGLRPSRLSWPLRFASILLIVLYWAKSNRLLSDQTYVNIFLYLASYSLRHNQDCIIYCYQDYLLPLMKRSRPNQRFISEFIIQFPACQANLNTSVEAALLASGLVAPTSIIINELKAFGVQASLAPYGGNKVFYRTDFAIKNTNIEQSNNPSITDKSKLLVAARSNSFRKGLDILLDALEVLNYDFPVSQFASCEVVICGNVSEKILLDRLDALSNLFKLSGKIQIKSGQLLQDDYLKLLEKADIFVMPSRLEGSSYAALEALWQGVPCILSSFCGVEMFRPGTHGELLHPLNSYSLQKSLRQILLDPCQLQDFRVSLKRDQDLFTWQPYITHVAKFVNGFFKHPT